jgi:ABC-2 type transport system ATP-binding protein
MAKVVEVEGLRKTYGATVAVDEASFSVEEGEIFGILGPNGVGKTTTVECIVGLRTPDAGEIRVLGLDPRRQRDQLREQVGVQLQQSALAAKLKVGEALELYRSFYSDPDDPVVLMDALGLSEKRDTYFKRLSGGQKQRLSIALALIGRPKVAVLDELTTGLDPGARRDTWELIEGVRQRGVTILLVTHYMDEAERLCDRVALFDAGRIVAIDSPQGLAAQVQGGKLVRFLSSGPFAESVLTGLPEVCGLEWQGEHAVVRGSGDLVNAVILALDRVGVAAHHVEMGNASLEDAFVRLTGDATDPMKGNVRS